MSTSKDKLNRLISEISTLQLSAHGSSELSVWYKAVIRTLKAIFGENDDHVKQFTDISFTLHFFSTGTPDSDFQEKYLSGLKTANLYLRDIFDEIPDTNVVMKEQHVSAKSGSDVFIVHGRDNESKQETARLIEKLNLNAIILHEQPNKGRTVIEKLQQESKTAGYAVILLTPDDIGTVKGKAEFEDRARQNVVLELGYFLGKLGRERMCILLKDSTSIPSDFSGIVYINMDSAGSWKLNLAKELAEAEFPINFEDIS